MLKLHQVFFLNFLGVFIGTLALSSIAAYISIKTTTINDHKERLQKHLSLLELQLPYVTNLDNFASDIHDSSDLRVTVIDNSGIVLAESNKDKTHMDNHKERFEIMQAKKDKYGFAVRYSETLGMDFIYVSKVLVYNNQEIFFRLSVSLESAMQEFSALWLRLAMVFSFFIFISLFTAIKISKKIKYDSEQIINYLHEISEKNYKAVVKPQNFSEFLYISVSLKNLAKRLKDRAKQKRKYTARLRLVNKQRADILSAISHEFKNPIASIQGYAETLIDDPEADVKLRKRFLQKIMQNSQKITSMIDRLSLSIKLENKDLELHRSNFDICLLTQDVIMNMGKKYKDRAITFSGEEFIINADKTMIETVITNLIDNAMKYSDEDITVSIIDHKLMVIDKGIGIAEQDINKVSTKFYRVQKNTWDNSMGLGLAIVSYVLTLHHSTLSIESKEEEGSIFAFELDPMKAKKTKKSGK